MERYVFSFEKDILMPVSDIFPCTQNYTMCTLVVSNANVTMIVYKLPDILNNVFYENDKTIIDPISQDVVSLHSSITYMIDLTKLPSDLQMVLSVSHTGKKVHLVFCEKIMSSESDIDSETLLPTASSVDSDIYHNAKMYVNKHNQEPVFSDDDDEEEEEEFCKQLGTLSSSSLTRNKHHDKKIVIIHYYKHRKKMLVWLIIIGVLFVFNILNHIFL